jgi:DNA-binding transcriptional regulator PaaX
VRLREIGATVGITERRVWGIVDDLAQTGYIVKEREGRRTSYRIQVNALLDEAVSRPQTIGQLMTFLIGSQSARRQHSIRT